MIGKHVWKRVTNEIREECCLDESSKIQCMRSIHGHSGGQQMNPRLQNNVLVLYGWSDHIYHVRSSHDYQSISEADLFAGGIGFREGRQ